MSLVKKDLKTRILVHVVNWSYLVRCGVQFLTEPEASTPCVTRVQTSPEYRPGLDVLGLSGDGAGSPTRALERRDTHTPVVGTVEGVGRREGGVTDRGSNSDYRDGST